MEDFFYPPLTSTLSGFAFNKNKKITTIRILTILILVGSFSLFEFDFNLTGLLIYSIFMTTIVWIVKFTLYVINKILNKSLDISDSASDQASLNLISSIKPDTMTSRDFENTIRRFEGRRMDDNDVVSLIEEGYDPSLAFQLYITVNNNFDSIWKKASRKLNNNPTKKRFLNICGKKIPFNISRLKLNEVFPMNDSFLYLLLGYFFMFSTYFLIGYNIREFRVYRYILYFVCGGAVYSFLAPPEEEAYSLTKGDVMNGLTRTVYITIIMSVWTLLRYLSDEKGSYTINFIGFSLVINFKTLLKYLSPAFIYLVTFLFFFIHLIIASPKTTFHYIIEAIDTYAFGCGLSARLSHAVFLFIRGSLAFVAVYFWGTDKSNSYQIPLLLTVVSLIVQFPLSWTTQLQKGFLSYVFYVFCILVLTFLSAFTMNKTGSRAMCLSLSIIAYIFDWVVPRMMSNNSYVLFHFRFFGFTSKVLNWFKIVLKAITAPAIICYAINNTIAPLWMIAIVVVSGITRSLCEPHVYSFSLIIMFFTFHFDFVIHDYIFAAILSLLISRKLLNIVSLMHFYKLLRPPLPFETNEESIFYNFGVFLLCKIYAHFPFSDRLMQFPTLIWSALSGSAIYSPGLVSFFTFPSSPKPSAFWDEVVQLDASTSFTANLTEHPVEMPVYTSFAKSLTNSLNGLIKSGRLGVVDSGDIFLFINDALCSFVEVIACDTGCCYFKVRGLEYSSETICHRTELTALNSFIQRYRVFPNSQFAMLQDRTNWDFRAMDVHFLQYSVDKFSMATSFSSLEQKEIRKWITLSFAYIYANSKSCRKAKYSSQSSNEFINACKLFGVSINSKDNEQIINAYEIVISYLFSDKVEFIKRFINLFQEKIDFNQNEVFVDSDTMEDFVNPSIRFSLIVLALASMQLSPDVNDYDEIAQFFEETNEKYVAIRLQSDNFDKEFKREEKDILTIAHESNPLLLFFRIQMSSWNIYKVNRESIRMAWQSESIGQIYFLEDMGERISIQSFIELIHNLTIQSCDHPLGYPALISPVIASYELPPGTGIF